MSPTKNNAIADQVGDRLDDIFGEGSQGDNLTDKAAEEDSFGEDVAKKRKKNVQSSSSEAGPESSLVENLKSVILSLEWEINDQIMQKLGEEIDKLKGAYKNDKIVVAFLQLLDSLGKYIQKKKAEAHPESISLLNSVHEQLEVVMSSEDMSEAEKKKMLVAQVNQYKKLKEELKKDGEPKKEAKTKKEPVVTPPVNNNQDEDDDSLSDVAPQDIIQALREINKTIKSEIGALRKELKLWRESQ
ncbi:hypothetical protein QUF72_16445 [Desulfobacterales bacterium HSG2]|nr:hypothetical protein [Desulfobacterales bacterium HSG2]